MACMKSIVPARPRRGQRSVVLDGMTRGHSEAIWPDFGSYAPVHIMGMMKSMGSG
jgi:hypothetical protein